MKQKKATGGLPKSIWETYSAFANTIGGIILLGVEEQKDCSLKIAGVPFAEEKVKEFWDIINNSNKVSANILSDKNISIHEFDGNKIIIIEVPRAQRTDKPIYIDNNPMTGTYRRNGEGDYRCSKEAVQAMLRDASVKTQDMIVLDKMGLDVFDYESVRRYRIRMKNYRPGHVWEDLSDEDFLYKLGAVARGEDGQLHPTAAGLLMFGYEYEIVKEYPNFFLDYQEQLDVQNRWTDRIVSNDGTWSGNIYDFYFKVYNKIVQDIKTPFKLEGGDRIDDTPVHKALREALANALINADYHGRKGIVIKKRLDIIEVSNPGGFRVDIEDAKCGGVSDPRNTTLIKMFNLINIGERAGSGIPNIYDVWKKQGWYMPEISEEFNPDRIVLSLSLENEKKPPKKTAEKKPPKKTAEKMELIIRFLTDIPQAKSVQISQHLGLSERRTREILTKLIESEIVETEGETKNRIYRLKR